MTLIIDRKGVVVQAGKLPADDLSPGAFMIKEGDIMYDGPEWVRSFPSAAFVFARCVRKGPAPELEDRIAESAIYSVGYAIEVLHGPFVLGERNIVQSRMGTMRTFQIKESFDDYVDMLQGMSLGLYIEFCLRNGLPIDI